MDQDNRQENTQNPPLPMHIAIIMDGNGRWAKGRGLPRSAGHKAGAEAVKHVIKTAGQAGVRYLTLFSFSSENWRRPETEINALMGLLRYYLKSETAEMHKNNIRLKVIGDRKAFADDIVEMIDRAEELTRTNDGITVLVALNYGGLADITQAAAKAAAKGEITEQTIAAHLMTAGIPDPDLLIRTSGEQRISNFLLWQCAYTELYFTDTLWPDFSAADFKAAIDDFAVRERRFGGV
jgi:undecaprenyl diphosphate synthase